MSSRPSGPAVGNSSNNNDYHPVRTRDYDEHVEHPVDSPPSPPSSDTSPTISGSIHPSSRKLIKVQNESLKVLGQHVQRISDMSLHISNELELQSMEIGRLETETEEMEYEANGFQRIVFNLLQQESNCTYIAIIVIIVVLLVLIFIKFLYEHHYIT